MKWIKRQNFGVIALILVVILVFGHIVGATIGDNVREQQIAKVLKEFVLEEQKIETKYWESVKDKYTEEDIEKIFEGEYDIFSGEPYDAKGEAEKTLKKFTTDNCNFFTMDNLSFFTKIENLEIERSKYDIERINPSEINVYMELVAENKEYKYYMTERYLYAEMIKVDGTWTIKYFKFSSQGRDSGLIW